MKIALVSPYDWACAGGVNNHISYLAKYLTLMGHQVRILAPCSQPSLEGSQENLIVVGNKVASFPTGGSVARISISARLSGRVKEILGREQFDIIHLHEPLLPAVCITILRFSQTINVGTFHAYHGSSRGYSYSRFILNQWFRKLHGRIAVSPLARDFINRYFRGHYEIIPNGIEVERFSMAEPLETLRDGKLNLLFVGRLEKRKGLDYLLGAYEIAKKEMPELRLVVVSPEGPAKDFYERMAEDRGLKDVVFSGFVPDQDLPRYYRMADVFCAPSTGKESFGIILLEAMASGRPIVASRIDGYANLMTDGAEGLLVEPKNREALAQALLRLVKDEELRRRMGAVGQRKAQDYRWEGVAQQVADYYEKIVQEFTPLHYRPSIREWFPFWPLRG